MKPLQVFTSKIQKLSDIFINRVVFHSLTEYYSFFLVKKIDRDRGELF